MKAILEFDLNDPDDIVAHKRAVKSLDMACAIFALVYNTKKDFEDNDLTDRIFERINEVLREHDVNIDELII